MTEAPESLELQPDATAASAARHFVGQALGPQLASDVVDAVSLVASELVTNAVLHAGTTVRLSLARTEEGSVRIEVADQSPNRASPRHYSDDSATGRGLVLVGALARRWGVDPSEGGGGKTVWAEVDTEPHDRKPGPDADSRGEATGQQARSEAGDALRAVGASRTVGPPQVGRALQSPRPRAADGMVRVRLLSVPVDAYHRASEHSDELQREFALILERDPSEGIEPPGRLLAIINELNGQFGSFGGTARARLEEAVDRGLDRIDLDYDVPSVIGPVVTRLADLFDEADTYCRGGDLLTLAAPPAATAFRRWFLAQFTGQAQGAEPESWDDWVVRHEKEDTQEI
ncbi:MAG TPA: ATP-binding protein [Acidimicrobiales bacterium]|nr:ATP-binding protein [Acidimicrobiales bacterium]